MSKVQFWGVSSFKYEERYGGIAEKISNILALVQGLAHLTSAQEEEKSTTCHASSLLSETSNFLHF